MNYFLKLQFVVLLFLSTSLSFSAQPKELSAPAFDAFYCVRFLAEVFVDGENTAFVPQTFNLNKNAVDEILAKRHAKKVFKKPFVIDGETYQPYALLGLSSAWVYLGKTAAGKIVVIKHAPNQSDPILLEYEAAVTDYYRSQGVDLPAIIAIDPEQGLLVKEYEEGLTYDEIKDREDELLVGPRPQYTSFFSTLTDQQLALHGIHLGFKAWLINHKPALVDRLLAHEKGKDWLQSGDHSKPDNFIFSITKGRWVLIDP